MKKERRRKTSGRADDVPFKFRSSGGVPTSLRRAAVRRLYDRLTFINMGHHWILQGGRAECDDWVDGSGQAHSGFWRIVLRFA